MARKMQDGSSALHPKAKDEAEKISNKRKRLNLDLAPAAYELLEQLSTDTGKSMTEVLRTGLALVGIAYEEKQQGRSLGIIEGEKVIKEILLP